MRKMLISGVIALSALTGCAGLSERDQRVFGGAAIGGVAGNVLSGGSGAATVGGAILGGLLGSEVDRNRNDNRNDTRYNDQRLRYDECRRYNSRRDCDGRRY